jgi:methyl-accepting chemotaxis protein
MRDAAPRERTLESLRVHMLLATLSTAFALTLMLCAALFVPLFVRLGAGNEVTAEVLRVSERLLFLHDHFWPVALVCLAAPCFSSYFLYRRMTEPLVRFRRVFAALASGAVPPPVRLRTGDYLTREVDALNRMLDGLRERARDAESGRAELDDAIVELQELAQADGDELRAGIESLGARYKPLRERLRFLAAHP